MDFKNSDIATGSVSTNLTGADASASLEGAALVQLALQAGNIMPLTADGQLVLPAGVGLDDIKVVGRDLIIQMPDGTQMIVPDGAIFVPQIVVEGVAVPPLNIAALLIGQEPQPAAGLPQSSGGNFADSVGDIGDPFALGDLLPPTALAFPEPEVREVVPGLIDRDPDVVIQDGGPAGRDVVDNVSETGLPGTRGNGNVETPGSSAGNGSDSTTGTIFVTSPDGIASITINGVVVTGVAGQQIITPRGVLTLGALNGDQIGYTFRLTDNTAGDATSDVFVVTVTDPDGDVATARLTINIADDSPTARNDTDSIVGGTYGPVLGNVLSGGGTTSGAAGADTLGADGAAISGVRAGTTGNFVSVGTTINGQYGTLTLGADGNYTYVRNLNTPGGVTDVFSYQLTDGDGDNSAATLTINIGDAPNRITFIPEIGDGTIVREPHLPARDNEPSGSQFDGNPETTSGTITFNSPDGVGSVTVSGVVLTPGALPQQVSSNATGSLVVTGYTYNPVTGVGSITYVYTLNDNTLNTNGESVSFPVVVTDLDGDVATDDLIITIVDDAPLAANDSGSQQSANAAVAVNVFVNDTPGADGVNLATGVSVVAGSLTGAGALAYNNNGTFNYVPAPGEEGVVTFQYTITDGDGDTSTATVTITLLKDSVPSVEVSGENVVAEAGLPSGSDAAANSETTSGTIAVATGNDTLASLVINGVDVTAGGIVTGASGVLTISVSEGAYSYSYTLTDNTAGDTTTDSFNVVVTDSDGDSANDTLVIAIQDDVPTAADDTDTVAAGTYGPATGNVVTDAEGDGGEDTQGADGATVTAVTGSAAGTVGGTTAGTYGVLTLNADGSYSYARNPGTAGGVSDVFSYTLTDGDGDTSTATLTISIADSPTTLDLPTAGEAGTLVDEAGLPAGSDAASNSETTSGTIAFTAPDGPATVTIDGVAVTAINQTFNGSFGILTVTSIANGTIGYSYTLTTNTAGNATFDDFAIVVTDQDSDAKADTLVISIVDDVPTARADVDSVTEDGPTVADGNVITGANNTDGVVDTAGADGASVTAIAFGVTNGTVGAALSGTYGSLTMNADGSYSYALNNANPAVQGLDGNDTLTEIFTYTITDGDGDTSTTTLTVTINGSDDPITINGLSAEGPDLTVDEDDLSDGSSPNDPALTQTGSFTVNGLDGILSIKIGGTDVSELPSFANTYGTFTITSISAPVDGSATAITIGYSYVLTDNAAHANANGQNFITELFNVEVTDTDGSTDTDQVEVRIIDDVPTAVNDTDVIASGSNLPAVGNVITDAESDGGEDTAGADTAVVTAITGAAAGTVGGTTAGTYGVLTLNADGSYSYTRNDGTPGNVQDVFSYTITDGDGDTSTATLTITIQDDRPFVGPNAVVLLDDDALAGGNAGGTGDDVNAANTTGTLSGSGGDGALTFAFVATDEPAGFTYDVTATPGSLLVFQGATKVLTVTLNSATGAYTVTQNAPIIHTTGNDENNASFTLNYTVTDVDGDAASGTLGINVDDDTPVAANDSDSVKEDGPLSASGNVLTGAGSDGNPAGADSLGADGPAAGGAVVAVTGGTVGTPIVGSYGSLTLNSNGSYTYALDNNNAAVQALDVGETLTQVYTYTVRDADGDTATATLTITINGTNDAPVAVADTNWTIEDASAAITGNVLNTIAHLGAPDAAVRGDVADTDLDIETLTVTTTGVLNGAYGKLTLNADGSYSYSYSLYTQAENPTAYAAVQARDVGDAPLQDVFNYSITDGTASAASTLTIAVFGANDAPVANNDTNWVLDVTSGANPTAIGNVLSTIAHPGAPDAALRGDVADTDVDVEPLTVTTAGTFNGTYGTLVLNANGTYTYTLNANNAAVNALDTNETLVESFGYTASDGTATANATLTITIFGTNDAPVASPDTNWVLEDSVNATGNVLDNVSHNGAPDAAVRGDVADTDVDVEPLTVTPDTLTGTYGTLTLNANGSYSYALNNANPVVQGLDTNDVPLADVFMYTVSDGAASVNSTVTISIFGTNDAPVVGVATAIVSEEGLANGRIDSTGVPTDSTNAVVANGNITITDVDGEAYTVTLGNPGAVLTADGLAVTWTGAGTGTIIGSVGSTEVIRVAITNTGAFTVTLSQSVDHPTLNVEDLVSFTVPVSVSDGTATVSSTLTVVIEDDSPLAVNDGQTTIEGAAAFGGNVLTNDLSGADTPAVVTLIGASAIGANPVVVVGNYGSLTINASGAYTYTPNASVPSGSVDSFTYTMRDADGDTSTATLQITFAGDANVPAASNVTASVDDDGLAGNNPASATGDLADPQPSPAGDGNEATFVGNLGFNFGIDGPAPSATDFVFTSTSGTVGTETVSYAWNNATSTMTATVNAGPRTGTILFDVVVNQSTGAYTLTLRDNVIHAPGGNENDALASLDYTVTDSDGSTAIGSLAITFDDDAPTLGVIQNGTANNLPASALTTGALNFIDGADDTGPVGTISLTTTGITSGGKNIVTEQVGNVLTGYADVDLSGTKNVGDTAVFTLTVNPAAGASGQYVFDLIAPLDGVIVNTPIGGSSSFGAGPTASQILSDTVGGSNLAVVSGWLAGGSFNAVNWYNGTDQLPAGLTLSSVNGSTGGWGVANNNFTAGEFLRFDFGAPMDDFDGAGPYVPPVVSLPPVSYATFDLIGYGGTDTIQFRVHYTDGTSANQTATGTQSGYLITAPAGKFIDWIDLYTANAGGSGKIDLTAVGVQNTFVDRTLGFNVTLTDGDGDAVTGSFSVNVKDGNTPSSSSAPVVLDLDGDGVEFVSAAAGVTFDYHGDGSPESTAWVSADDGLLALDRNGDGIVNDGSEIVFARDGLTDLQGLAADFDSNQNGVLDASDADFAKFGVWQDANSNGVTDAGEYRSLLDAGIVNIGLVSDGNAYSTANGSVSVAGHSLYGKADGSTAIVADAAFATGGTTSVANRSSDQIRTSNVTTSVIAAALVGLAVEENLAAAPDRNLSKTGDVVSENVVAANDVEPATTGNDQTVTPLALGSEQEVARETSNEANSTRVADDADDFKSLQDAPVSLRSALLEDSHEPSASDQGHSAFAFGGGDQVMHSMLDIAAFTASAGASDNAALPLPIEDAVREAMPDLMVDRLIDAFTAEVGTPANDAGEAAGDSALLAGMLDQGIDGFHISAMTNNDISGSHQYEMATISHG